MSAPSRRQHRATLGPHHPPPWLPALALILLLAACGRGEREDPLVTARNAARSSLLVLNDLPQDWTQPPAGDPGNLTRAQLDLQGECAIFNEANASGFAGELVTAESPQFSGPDRQQAASSATVFDSRTTALAAVESADDLIGACAGEIEAAARRLVEDAMDEEGIGGLFTDINIAFAPVPLSSSAESTIAYRLRGDVSALTTLYQFTADVAVLRQGPIVAVLTYFREDEPDEAEVVRLTEGLAARLANAAATLTEQ